jgi:nitroreductase
MTPTAKLGLTADQVLTTTRAVRKRLDFERPVSRELLEECVSIARQAPSGRNRQRWDFIFIGDERKKAAVAELWMAGLRAHQTSDDLTRDSSPAGWQRIAASLTDLAARLHDAPWLMIPCVRVSSRAELDDVRGQAGAWGSVLPAAWSFMLAARERGLGTAWTTAHLTYEREVAEVIGIPYETVVQAALTPVAHTVGTDFAPARRAPVEQFIHWDQW